MDAGSSTGAGSGSSLDDAGDRLDRRAHFALDCAGTDVFVP